MIHVTISIQRLPVADRNRQQHRRPVLTYIAARLDANDSAIIGRHELIDEALKQCSTYHIDGGGEDAILEMVLANAGIEGQLVASDKDEVVFLVTPGRQPVMQPVEEPVPVGPSLVFARTDPDPEENPNDDPPLYLN